MKEAWVELDHSIFNFGICSSCICSVAPQPTLPYLNITCTSFQDANSYIRVYVVLPINQAFGPIVAVIS